MSLEPFVVQQLFRAPPLLWILLESFLNEVDDEHAIIFIVLKALGVYRVVEHLCSKLFLGLTYEGLLASQEDIGDNAEGPDVGLTIVSLGVDFGRHV